MTKYPEWVPQLNQIIQVHDSATLRDGLETFVRNRYPFDKAYAIEIDYPGGGTSHITLYSDEHGNWYQDAILTSEITVIIMSQGDL